MVAQNPNQIHPLTSLLTKQNFKEKQIVLSVTSINPMPIAQDPTQKGMILPAGTNIKEAWPTLRL